VIRLPIPKPHPKEDQQTFVSRCISELHKIDPNRPQKQVIAICYSTWRNSKRKRTTQETQEIVEWYETKIRKGVPKRDGSGKGVQANKGRGGCPKWVQMVRRLLASKRGNPKLRSYWQKRLDKYEGENK